MNLWPDSDWTPYLLGLLQSNATDGTRRAIGSLLKNYTELDLTGLSIGDRGAAALAAALADNETITSLTLSHNKIGDDGAAALAAAVISNSTLKKLKLSHNKIGDRGAAALADGLKTNSTLTGLGLYSNKIGDKGAAALADGLKTNNTITDFGLHYNDGISNIGMAALADALETNTHIRDFSLDWLSAVPEQRERIERALTRNKSPECRFANALNTSYQERCEKAAIPQERREENVKPEDVSELLQENILRYAVTGEDGNFVALPGEIASMIYGENPSMKELLNLAKGTQFVTHFNRARVAALQDEIAREQGQDTGGQPNNGSFASKIDQKRAKEDKQPGRR